LKTPHKVFEDYLLAHEGRYTTQKRVIVDEIFKIRTHFEVEDFIDRLRHDKQPFSRATVYRTIKQLLEAGLLQKLSTRDGKVFYERSLANKQHDHIICNSCGKIFEIKEDYIAAYIESFCKMIGFSPEYRSLHVYGRCQKCRESNSS